MSLLSRLAVQAARAYGILSSDKNALSANFLVVAGGGGGGGGNITGGGGAGGFRTSAGTSGGGASAESPLKLSTLNTYSIVVGAGGVGGLGGDQYNGSVGVASSISGTGLTTITSVGGGNGGGNTSIALTTGGSGGGSYGVANGPGSGTANQGYNGGRNWGTYGGGGGGGAGAAGGGVSPGNGGTGVASSISGSSVTYAGGGGAGGQYLTSGTFGAGGSGGGGNGGTGGSNNVGLPGTTNTGGGGGGAAYASGHVAGGAGGSGIVIISYTSATPKFVGGTLTTSGGNQIHTFTSSGTLSPLTPVTASYLVVAGGGGGGGGHAGGGGAGGLLTSSTTLYSGATYVVTVGAGGTGGIGGANNGVKGSDSVLSGTGLTTVTSTGGGYGAKSDGANQAGGTGGSGGGGANGGAGGAGNTPSTSPSQGSNGGSGSSSTPNYGGGGGGGASAVGGNGTGTTGGNGGSGSASSITGSSVTYAGGGGGGTYVGGTAGTGGSGGGGAGSASTNGTAGTANTGGGGGGAFYNNTGGAGGSGTVIISYAGSQVFNGGLVTSSGGNTIHTFNATGALTPLTNNLNNSLRFRASNSAYLNRTPTVAGNRKTWTWSAWVKRGALTGTFYIFGARQLSTSTPYSLLYFASNDRLTYIDDVGSTVQTSQVFRDSSAWYHIVLSVDTTQATAANRYRMYVNGSQVTSFGSAVYAAQNSDTAVNAAIEHDLGIATNGSGARVSPFDGYMTDINFIDGQALEPYYFGNNDAYGNWKPIKYTGMYGTNGFYLTFADASAATAAAIGKDSSGNGNNWTPNNISVTAGTTYDAMTDVPTNTSATVANYCVNNPVDTSPAGGVNAITISGANLNLAGASTDWAACRATIGVTSGKWYWECTRTGANNLIFGIGLNSTTLVNAYSSTSYGYFSTGDKYSNNVSSAYGASFTSGDVIGVAFDADAGTLTFYKNNTSQGTAYTGLTSGPYFPLNQLYTTGSTASINFGQRPFTYTPPSGFVALNTYNLPTPTILQGNKYMDATTFTGTSGAQSIVNQGQFKPDFVWIKNRNSTQDNYALDSVRGGTKLLRINTTGAETTTTSPAWITSFNSNGFSSDSASLVTTGYTYVGWQWQANQGSTVSNTSGTITSTVSVNATAGFSVVTYTGTGTAATVGHGLGVAPAMIIIKRRNGVTDWAAYHASVGNTKAIFLNRDIAADTSASYWNNTSPTSTLFTVGTGADVNPSSGTMVAYCFAEIAGYSKFGSYTGNASADGPFVYTGFRPKFVLVKGSSYAANWNTFDAARNTYNVTSQILRSNLADAEFDGNATTGGCIDILSNGFKIRKADGDVNSSGQTIIYMAFAENPFKNANAR